MRIDGLTLLILKVVQAHERQGCGRRLPTMVGMRVRIVLLRLDVSVSRGHRACTPLERVIEAFLADGVRKKARRERLGGLQVGRIPDARSPTTMPPPPDGARPGAWLSTPPCEKASSSLHHHRRMVCETTTEARRSTLVFYMNWPPVSCRPSTGRDERSGAGGG
jgi:hypothetical protein